MIRTIHEGHHRAFPPSLGIYWDKRIIRKKVKFLDSCRYEPDAENDVNKLFGLGYLPGHHVDSARFGWRFDKETDKIEILYYVYIARKRLFDHICMVDIGKEYEMLITNGGYSYNFICDTYGQSVRHWHDKKLAYPLGCYFGGDNPSPHKMQISIR